jgi:pilus assembly protein CpaC
VYGLRELKMRGQVRRAAPWTQARARFSRRSVAIAIAASLAGLALIAGAALVPARAADARLVDLADSKVGGVRVTLGKSETLRTSRGFVDLVVGDPDVADVMPLTDQTLYVLGKKIGTTNVSVYDASKQLVGVIEVEVGYNTPRLAAEMALKGPGGARIGSANGRTVLSGEMPDGVSAAKAVALAKQYGPEVLNELTVRGPQQVMLEVRFVEASRNAGRELGVNWEAVGRNYGNPTRAALNFAAASGTGTLASGHTPFGALIGRVLSGGVEADVLVQALEERGLARRLAEPNLIAMSGEKASFLAGGEFPIPVQAEQGRITVDYKKFGVGLTFTPTVLSNGVINLKIEPEVSQLDPTNFIRTSGIAIPALIVRRASTVIELRDGQSFAIAGLLQSINQETQQQLPWIADIPIIGALFRSAAFERKETDLAIIVTPRLVQPAKPGQRLRTPLDPAVPANDADLFLTGQQEIPVGKARAAGTRPIPIGHILDVNKERTRVVARN